MINSLSESLNGVNPDVVERALRHCKGNPEKALDLLTQNPKKLNDLMKNDSEDHQKFRDAWSRMDEDLGDDEDHLDLTLVDEAKYLEQYKKLMNIQ